MSKTDVDKSYSQYIFGDKARKPILMLCAFVVGVFIAGSIAGHQRDGVHKAAMAHEARQITELDKFNEAEALRDDGLAQSLNAEEVVK